MAIQSTTLTIATLAAFAILAILLYLDGRGLRKALAAARATVAALQRQTTANDAAIGNLSRAVALLAPPDARPTTADQARARLPAAPANASRAPVSAAAPGPRMRADIRPSGFASDRIVAILDQGLTLDARDVDEREGTMRVEVLDATSRAEAVLVTFPAERIPRGPRLWVPRALVLDLENAPPPAPPPAPVETDGDRGGINPGDPLVVPATPLAPLFEGKTRIKVKIEAGVFLSERSVSFDAGGRTYALFANENAIDAVEGTMLVDVVDDEGADDDAQIMVDLPGEALDAGGRRVRIPRDVILGLPDEKTSAFSAEAAARAIAAALSTAALERPASSRTAEACEAAKRTIETDMAPEELARVDAFALRLGISREQALERLTVAGIDKAEELLRPLGIAPATTPDRVHPTTPPERVTPPGIRAFDPLVAARWEDLIREARERGETVGHCGNTGACVGGEHGIASCVCRCDGCDRIATLRAQAERDVRRPRH